MNFSLLKPAKPAHPPHRTPLLVATVLLSLLTTVAVFAAGETKVVQTKTVTVKTTTTANTQSNIDKRTLEHGQGFENAHGTRDDSIVVWKRDSTTRAQIAAARPRHGNPTYMNRKMNGHWKHEERPSRTPANAKRWQDKRMWRQEGTWGGSATWQGMKAADWQAQHATWPERGGYGGAFVSQADYDRHFSTAHDFRLKSQPDMKDGYPHFKRDGAHFVMVDPYPQHWNGKWYETDDVYIQYDQGYYLHNRKDPGYAIAVMVLQ